MGMNAPDRVRCAQALDQLLVACDGVVAAMLALRDGRPFLDRHRTPHDSGKFAAMSSSLVALGHSVLKELKGGTLDHVLIDGSEGKLVISSVPNSNGLLLLAVLAERDARLGLVLGHAKTCAQTVGSGLTASAKASA